MLENGAVHKWYSDGKYWVKLFHHYAFEFVFCIESVYMLTILLRDKEELHYLKVAIPFRGQFHVIIMLYYGIYKTTS